MTASYMNQNETTSFDTKMMFHFCAKKQKSYDDFAKSHNQQHFLYFSGQYKPLYYNW